MAASVFDSPLYAQLFPTGETGRLFSDSAAIRAMLLVEGALAKAQGQAGVIPEVSAAAIQRASLEIQIDPGALAQATGQNGVPVPGLIAAFCAEMNAPEHAHYVHWGATSQDIIDTGLMLRFRQALILAETDIRLLITHLAQMAETYADTPMAARSFGQFATPTTWGGVVAQWGAPLIDALEVLPALRSGSLWVSLSGASGTSSALGSDPRELRAALADGLGLEDPGRSWHTDRGPILRITDWMNGVVATLGAMGTTLTALAASGLDEINFGSAGASSTMPQKQNPVGPASLVALSNQMAGLRSTLSHSASHQHQRDGAAWFSEWMVVPQIALTTAAALNISVALAKGMAPNVAAMKATLDDGPGLMIAEALTFALAERMPRPDAQAKAKELCQKSVAENTPLPVLARATFPELPIAALDPLMQIGDASEAARRFATRAHAV